MNHTNDYYVYIYWRLDTNEPFYIGKGRKYRLFDLHNRNKHFKNILNKIPVMVEVYKECLTDEEASGIECWLINELVFEYGFSIDIPKNRSDNHYCHLCNMTWGGEGISGHNPWEGKSEEEIKDLKTRIRNNTLEQWKNMSEEVKKERSEKISKANKGRNIGKKNGMYGKNTWEDMTKEEKEERIKKISVANGGKNNAGAKAVICLTTEKIFFTIKDGSRYYNCSGSSIAKCCNGFYINKGKKVKIFHCGKLSNGTPLKWMYLKDFLEKCSYTLL